MKVMVCLKQVPHQDARLDVREDGAWIKEDGIKFEINSYDTYALEEALRLKDNSEAEVGGRIRGSRSRHPGSAHRAGDGCRPCHTYQRSGCRRR